MADEQEAPVDVQAVRDAAPEDSGLIYHLEGADGKKFAITELAVRQSLTLNALVENLGGDGDGVPTIPLNNISDAIVAKIVDWCEKHKGEEIPEEPESAPKTVEVPEWDREFLKVDNEELFNIIVAANYLDIKQLMNYACKIVADMAKGKSPEEIRLIYGIPTDEEDERERLKETEKKEATVAAGPTM